MFDDFYGLTGRPFQLTPDPNFYFESTTHRKALSYLGYGLAQSEGFIVITGEIGSGKSTLVAHLMQKIDRDQMTVGQVVTSNLDGEELVHVAAQSFGLDVEGHDKASALGAIENFLHEEAREGRRCLLVVDESQNLSVEALEELRMLSNFQLGSHPLLQLLLLGQPEFKQVLAQHGELEQLRQRVIAAHHLEAMEPGEIEPYIKHRLECVGWQGNPDFDQRVFAELYSATGGIPRKVNQVVTRLLLLGAVEQRSRIDNAMLSAVLAEMQHDNAFPEAAPKPMEKLAPAPAPGPVKHASYPQPAPAPRVDDLLAERDVQIAELQQAVVELSEAVENGGGEVSDEVKQRIETLENRIDEQERMVRHVLTMMIEWMESGQSRAAA
ncbi:MAG: AAA family ATPase [Sphingomonadaceae bacterium]|nr:XrtA-associated ATPase [Sphingomonadaceae bacterium]MCP5383875.1 AAA family ATPase [Altererythrobacter sp.]MCP5392110.1 AAA family ATPase [Sphingomonadaceae bacterium]MCP5394238.1 AAA family ATPase [Sphingomonadaceae bacterium]